MILFIADFSPKGSGYARIAVDLCTELHTRGRKVVGLGVGYNHMKQHDFLFSLQPIDMQNWGQKAAAMIRNYIGLGEAGKTDKVEAVVIAMDIPHQLKLHQMIPPEIPHIAIYPIEDGPLTFSWAAQLSGNAANLIISKYGHREAVIALGPKAADYIEIGLDTDFWQPKGDKIALKKAMGYTEEDFVVLTVADNQERKNLSAGIKMLTMASLATTIKEEVSRQILYNKVARGRPSSQEWRSAFVRIWKYAKKVERINSPRFWALLAVVIWAAVRRKEARPIKYILLTREKSGAGWTLTDLFRDYGMESDAFIIERGIPEEKLRSMYAMADLLLLTSKAEGLCMPVLEAQACGLPVLLSHTSALIEHVHDDIAKPFKRLKDFEGERGWTIPMVFEHTGVFGNGRRGFVNIFQGVRQLLKIVAQWENLRAGEKSRLGDKIAAGLEYVQNRPASSGGAMLDNVIAKVLSKINKAAANE